MKVVLDTNVIISALMFGGKSRKTYDYCVSNCDVFISTFILEEVERVLRYKFDVGTTLRKSIRQSIITAFILSEPSNKVPDIIRDIADNKILQLAQFVNADFIITGDKDIHAVQHIQPIKIVTPATFLENIS